MEIELLHVALLCELERFILRFLLFYEKMFKEANNNTKKKKKQY